MVKRVKDEKEEGTDERIMERMRDVLQSKAFMVDGRDFMVDSRQMGSGSRKDEYKQMAKKALLQIKSDEIEKSESRQLIINKLA